MSKIEMLQEQLINCAENGCYFGHCEACKVAKKELWLLRGNSVCGANGGITKKGLPCGQWAFANERCELHA